MYIHCLRDLPLPIPPSSRSPRCGRNWTNPLRRAKPTTGLLGFDSVMGAAENSCWACSRWGAVNFHESPVRNSDNTGQYQGNEVEDCLYFFRMEHNGKVLAVMDVSHDFSIDFAVPFTHVAAVAPWQPPLCSFTGCVPCGTTARQNDFGRRLPDVKKKLLQGFKARNICYICYTAKLVWWWLLWIDVIQCEAFFCSWRRGEVGSITRATTPSMDLARCRAISDEFRTSTHKLLEDISGT